MIFCIAAAVTMQTVAAAQTAYSITDNNRDSTNLQQQYYQFDLFTGQGTLISELRGPAGQRSIHNFRTIETRFFSQPSFKK